MMTKYNRHIYDIHVIKTIQYELRRLFYSRIYTQIDILTANVPTRPRMLKTRCFLPKSLWLKMELIKVCHSHLITLESVIF